MDNKTLDKLCFVYITVPSKEESQKLAKWAVESRHAACGNIIPHMTSVYEWQGEICSREECILILKTTNDRSASLAKGLVEKHSDECPCVCTFPLESAYDPFVDWVRNQVQKVL
jgi:periplasmic divalent cation tolerance protein